MGSGLNTECQILNKCSGRISVIIDIDGLISVLAVFEACGDKQVDRE